MALAVSGLGAAGVTAQAQPGTGDPVTAFTKTADVRLTMRDGVSLDSDEYVPTTGCPCPVIVVQTPYRKSGTAVGEYNPYFPSHGYAEIVVDVRGTGSSEGYWTSFGPPEQADTVEIVKWATKRPFSNGVIGLAGVSYSAINQFLTAEQPGNEAVKAIFPIVPMGDAYRDVVFAGGNTDTGFIPLWLGLVNSLNALPADDATTQPQIALNVESQHLMDIAQFAAPAVGDSTLGAYESLLPSALQSYPDQAYDGPYYRTVDPLSHIDRVHVPTFIVGGEYDLFQRSEPLLYRGLDVPTTRKKLLFGPWYHGSPTANLTADDGSAPVSDVNGNLIPSTNNLALAWFDHWLKGVKNGVEAFPTVETWQIGANQWQPATGFPARPTKYQPWYLGATPSGSSPKSLYDGSLGLGAGAPGSTQLPWQPLTGACSRSAAQWTAGIVVAGSCPDDDTSAQVTGLTFTSAAFTQPYTVAGPIMADLWISSDRSDTTIVTTVDDVAPDGTVFRVTAGSLVASLRQVVSTPCGAKVMDCSVYAGGVPVVPWHPYTLASQAPLTADPTEIQVEVFPTSLVLEPGHRLRLGLTTGDLPHQGPNLSTLANSIGGVTTVYFDPAHPSRIYLGAPGAAATAKEAAPKPVKVAPATAVAAEHAAAPAQTRPAAPSASTLSPRRAAGFGPAPVATGVGLLVVL
ncbi:MAG TPA: CocE/NonD family hydrolase, partial [Candidatus Dormibacteraeota bacterium]|nr:CocE/NonD family hydrolase [Candidatus Dormibacteraeota bacterium]